MADTFFSSEEQERFLQRLAPQKKKAAPGASAGDYLGDLYSSAAQGVGSLIQGVGTFVAGSENEVAKLGERTSEYWAGAKSEKLKGQEAELASIMQDKDKGLVDAAAYVAANPYLATNMLAGSAPSMAVGMGAGGLVARGMASVGVMASSGVLTSMGSRLAGGIGEGLTLVPEVYSATRGNTEAGLAALALGVGTSLLTPGNLGDMAARKLAGGGVADATVTALNKTAARRFGAAIAGESAQEFGQEGGQALLEQVGTLKADGSPGDVDWASAGKQAAVGAVLGGMMGGGLHPVVGEGDPLKAKIAAQEAALADRRLAAEGNPNNTVLAAEVAGASARLDVSRLEDAERLTPTGPVRDQLRTELDKARVVLAAKEGRLVAEASPADQRLQDAADTAEGAAALAVADGDMDTVRNAASLAVASAAEGIQVAADIDSAVTTFATGSQASSVLRSATTGVQRVAEGVTLAMDQAYASDVAEGIQIDEFTPEQLKTKALGAEIETLRLRQQQAKTQLAETKLQREVETLRGKQTPVVEEITMTKPVEPVSNLSEPTPPISSDTMVQDQAGAVPGGSFRVEPTAEGFDVIRPDGQVYDSYRARQDAEATASQFNVAMDEAEPTTGEVDHDEVRHEIASLGNRLDGVLSFDPDGYPSEISNALRVLDRSTSATPQQMHRAVGVMSAYVNTAYRTGLMGPMASDIVRHYGNLSTQTVDRIRKLIPSEAKPQAQAVVTTPQPAPAAPARRDIAAELRALEAEVEAENAPAPAAAQTTPQTEEGSRIVTQDFTRRAEAAKQDGTLNKLAAFWRKIMRGKGQRTLPKININDLVRPTRAAIDAGGRIPQATLTAIQDRYNAALKANAIKWAQDNNQAFNANEWVDPVQGMTPYNDGSGTYTRDNAGFRVEIYPLNRGAGKNPYMVPVGAQSAPFSAGNSIHAVSIQSAKGAADLGYRLAAEIANLRGVPFPSDATLLTVNNLRRQLQSMSADTLFGAGTINPLTRSGATGPQGIGSLTWENMTDDQRVGLNVLRAAHTISENRGVRGNIPTAARFIENLTYDRQGRIVATRDPITTNGFPRGTVVSDAMLDAKIGQIDPATGVKVYGADDHGRGGVGLSTAKLGILNNTILSEIEGDADATIPTWIETVAKREGRKMNGWFFSESDAAAGGVDRDFAASTMRSLLGDTVTKILLDSGIVSFVDTQANLTGGMIYDVSGNIQGATSPDGKIRLVLENLTPKSFSAVLQHEGLHATLKSLVGDKTYGSLMTRLETLVQAGQGSTWAKEAEARVQSTTLPENRTEEIAAYAVELAVKGEPETNPLVKWAKDFMSAIRAGIIKSKLMPEALKIWAMNNLQPQDLSRLALAGLRQRATQGDLISRAGGVRQSVAPATPLRTAAQYQAEIDSLMAEHVLPETTRARRAEINRNVAQLRTAWRVADEAEFARDRGLRLSVQEEEAVSLAPVVPPAPNELRILNLSGRRGFAELAERVKTIIADKHVTLNRIQRLAGVTSEKIRMDTMGALDRLGSRLMTQQTNLVKTPLAQMENTLAQAGWDAETGRKALDELLVNRHVAEYNAHIAEINPARYNEAGEYQGGYDEGHPGSGITDADAAKTIGRLTSADDAKTAGLIAAESIYRKMISDLQDYAVNQGLETRVTIDNWNKKFPNYAPFNRDLNLSEDPTFGTVPGGQGFSLRAGLSRRAMGSSADIVSPLVSTMLFGLKTTTRGENAEVARTVLDFVRNFTPKFRTEGGDWEPMFKVNTVQTQRVIKHVNVYQVTKADGALSREFYNREQARGYADAQQALWNASNPGADPGASVVDVQRIGDGPQARVLVQPIPNQLNQDNVLVVPENGENVVIEFDKRSEDAMRVLNAFRGATSSKQMNAMLTPFRMFSRWVQATATGYNPVFSIFNSIRDVQSAMVTIGADDIPGWTAADSWLIARSFPKAAAQIWAQEGLEFRALHSNETIDTTPKPGNFAAWMKDAAAFGGLTGVRESIYDAQDAETQIRRLFGQSELDKHRSSNDADNWMSKVQGVTVKVGDALARFGEGETKAPIAGWISKNLVATTARLNESTELATRTVVFKLATEKFMAAGKTEQEAKTLAAGIAKNVSTNFNRRGDWSSTLNQLFPFFNAAVQGSVRIAETIFEKQTYSVTKEGVVVVDEKTKMSSYGKKVIGALVALGGFQAIILAVAGFEDDEPPKHVRDRNFVIPFGAGNYLTIPMPHGLNTLINFGRESTLAVMNPKKALEHVANALWQLPAFNPFGSAGNTITDFSPALMDPFISLYMNEDAFGRPIAKEDRDPANPTPGFTRAKEGVSGMARALSRGINSIGGSDDRKGFVSPTPDQIDFVLGQVTGGVGREVGKVANAVSVGADMAAGRETEPMPSYKKPLIGRLAGNVQEPAALRSKVFDIRQEINQTYAEYKGLRDRRETVEARQFWQDHPELALRDDFERAAKQDSKMRKARGVARDVGEVSSVNKMTNQQDERLLNLVGRYKELTKD